MDSNKRGSNRVGLVIDIKVTCSDEKEYIYKSRNISDTGVFLEHNEVRIDLPINSHVILQVCSQLNDEDPPPVKAEVARITDEGIGIKFIL